MRGSERGIKCGDETIRAGKSVCSVKLSLRGSSPANLWDTYNASQEYCSVCRSSTFCRSPSLSSVPSNVDAFAGAARKTRAHEEEVIFYPNIEMYLGKGTWVCDTADYSYWRDPSLAENVETPAGETRPRRYPRTFIKYEIMKRVSREATRN